MLRSLLQFVRTKRRALRAFRREHSNAVGFAAATLFLGAVAGVTEVVRRGWFVAPYWKLKPRTPDENRHTAEYEFRAVPHHRLEPEEYKRFAETDRRVPIPRDARESLRARRAAELAEQRALLYQNELARRMVVRGLCESVEEANALLLQPTGLPTTREERSQVVADWAAFDDWAATVLGDRAALQQEQPPASSSSSSSSPPP